MERLRDLTVHDLPLPLRSIAHLRSLVLQDRVSHLQDLEKDQLKDFGQIWRILKDSEGLHEFGAGVGVNGDAVGSTEVLKFMKAQGEKELQALLALDLSISPPSPALLPILPDLPPEIQLDVSMLVDSVLEGSESDTPISTSNSVLPVVQEEPETDGDVEMEASTDGTPTTSASPAPIRLPILPSSSAILQSSSSSTNSPLRQVIPVPLISPMAPPVASTSELPTTSNSPPNSSSSQNIKTSLEATVALSPIVVPEIALEYTNLLPIIPSDLFRQRLIIKRKGKEKEKNLGMNGGFDLWKLHVKAQHTGAKTFLGRGKRVHNILSTADYGVAAEELRGIRAMERIEVLKSEKKWSFRQPKKQRPGVVPKAHWDHLLDEMRWMQTDFRQEKRWQIVCAHNLAKSVKAWHRASPEEKILLQVSITFPDSLEEGGEELQGSAEEILEVVAEERKSTEMDLDADGEADGDEVPVAVDDLVEDIPVVEKKEEVVSEVFTPKSPIKSALTAQQVAQLAELQQRQLATLNYQALLQLRAPIFDLGNSETILNPNLFSDSKDSNLYSSLEALFPELPAYNIVPVDLVHDKRIDEACIFSGRLTNVSKHFDGKPLLVSTLNPAKNKKRDNWTAMLGYNLEDAKELNEGAEVPAVASQLFSGPGRKGKEALKISSDPNSKVAPLPNAEIRATSLLWAPEEDQLLINLRSQYGSNWDMISNFFNSTIIRPSTDLRLPWDCYDRWDRLAGPSSKKMLEDGTEISIPLPEYVAVVDKGKGPQFSTFEGSKKRLRHLSVFDAMRKQQRKREATHKPQNGIPRRLNMNMHESHNLPARPIFSPIEWSNLKIEQDRTKMDLARRIQYQNQQEAALQQQRLQQQQLQQNGARYQQPPPQGFPLGRPQLPLNISHQNQVRLLPTNPSSPLPLGVNTSPRSANASPPIQAPNPFGVGQQNQIQSQQQQQQNGLPQLSSEQLLLLQRQNQLNQIQAQQNAIRQAQQQQAQLAAQQAQMIAANQNGLME